MPETQNTLLKATGGNLLTIHPFCAARISDKTRIPCSKDVFKKKIAHRSWPIATYTETQVRRGSLTRWCAAQYSGAFLQHPNVLKLLFAEKNVTGRVFLAMGYVLRDLTTEIQKTLDMNATKSCAQELTLWLLLCSFCVNRT